MAEMIEVTLWDYLKTKSRMLRFGKVVRFSAVPYVGARLELVGDSREVGEVIFKENGGITIILKQDDLVIDDEGIDEEVEMLSESGWELLSNVERHK